MIPDALRPADFRQPGIPLADMTGALSAGDLFMQADPVVKDVMLILLLASIVCWAITLDKALRLSRLGREIKGLESAAASLPRVQPAETDPSLAAAILSAGERELIERDERMETRAEFRERIERSMRAAMAARLRSIEPGIPFLATVGSAAPFIGLFGTVWGIINSFTSIAASNDTSLAVVAPGIAEALFATALGLIAAIPAVVAYNKLATALGRAAQRVDAAIGELGRRLSARPLRTLGAVEAAD